MIEYGEYTGGEPLCILSCLLNKHLLAVLDVNALTWVSYANTLEVVVYILLTSCISIDADVVDASSNLERSVYGNIVSRHYERELVVAKSKAEEADRKKTEFIQDLTHQIRTPLNIIGGFAQVLQNDCEMLLDEDIESISTGILQNSQDIQTIISNLLTISALEECSEIERTDEVACNAFCQEVMDSVILRYPATVSMSMETKVPDTFCIKTHRESLRMILRELLENANKFTKVGNITLHCRQQDAQWVEFSVSDTGQGVLPEDYERIFTMFTKLSAFSEGLGLGLYLSRRQARLMGGDIEIDKNYTGGSRFTVRLPLS